MGIEFNDWSPKFAGCWCGCCHKTDMTTNLPKNTYGAAQGFVGASKGALAGLVGGVKSVVGLATGIPPLAEDSVGEVVDPASPDGKYYPPHIERRTDGAVNGEFVVKSEPFTTFDYAVYGFATVGLAVLAFGAYKHFCRKYEEMNEMTVL